ncbi:MAG: helix-turn-helix domain-containing protein [Eubacterium sp.]|jgi:sugar-specific transcriptional regulator TrmB|nr:helix-turn-helix domain-containing protein [Eubacterium sp.]
MVDMNKMYLTAEEIAEILGVSKGFAYRLIRDLNAELKAKGFIVVAGKLPTKYFKEKFYGMTLQEV